MNLTPDEITYLLALAAVCWFGFISWRTLRDDNDRHP